MSLTDSEIMGGVGFGDEEYSFYNYAEDISHLIGTEGAAPGRIKTGSFDQMMSGEEISYLKHDPRIENSQYVYTNRANMRGKPEPTGREFARGSNQESYMIPEDLDNSNTVQRYLLNRLPTQNLNIPKRFQPPMTVPLPEPFRSRPTAKNKLEKFEESVQGVLGEHTVSMLLTIIFILIIALVILQVMNARRIQKLVKTILLNIPRTILVSAMPEKNQ